MTTVVLLAILVGAAVGFVYVKQKEELFSQAQFVSLQQHEQEGQEKEHAQPAIRVVRGSPPLLKVSASNGRYMANPKGNIVFLAGDYRNTLDWAKYLPWARSHGYTALRLMMNENGGAVPERYKRSAICCADDGGNKFDLDSYNQDLLDTVYTKAVDAGNNQMYAIVTLWGGAYFTQKSQWPSNPFKASNNINSINGDPLNVGYGDAVWFYSSENRALLAVLAKQKAWVHALIDQVNDLDNVIYEVCNECAWTLPPVYSGSRATADAWANEIIADIRSYEATKSKQHPILQSIAINFQAKGMQSTRDLISNSNADMLSPGGEYRRAPPLNDTPKVMINDTDHQEPQSLNYMDYPWESFTRGLQMLHWDATLNPFQDDNQSPARQMRIGIAGVLQYAARMNLKQAVPSLRAASTTYALVNLGKQYLVYNPNAGSFTVDLSAGAGKTFDVEWNNPINNAKAAGIPVLGGSHSQSFTSPFLGPSVLYLNARIKPLKFPQGLR